MDTLWNNVANGAQKPTLIPTTPAVFAFFGQLLRSELRIVHEVSPIKGGSGFAKQSKNGISGLDFNGVACVGDQKATSQALIFLNEDVNEWYALPMAMSEPIKYKSQIDGNDYDAPVGLGFSWSEWIKPTNAAAAVGHIYLGGQLISSNPRFSGKLTGITGI